MTINVVSRLLPAKRTAGREKALKKMFFMMQQKMK